MNEIMSLLGLNNVRFQLQIKETNRGLSLIVVAVNKHVSLCWVFNDGRCCFVNRNKLVDSSGKRFVQHAFLGYLNLLKVLNGGIYVGKVKLDLILAFFDLAEPKPLAISSWEYGFDFFCA